MRPGSLTAQVSQRLVAGLAAPGGQRSSDSGDNLARTCLRTPMPREGGVGMRGMPPHTPNLGTHSTCPRPHPWSLRSFGVPTQGLGEVGPSPTIRQGSGKERRGDVWGQIPEREEDPRSSMLDHRRGPSRLPRPPGTYKRN